MLFRKAVLIIHGFAGGTYDQEELANYLEYVRRFDVYRFTLPGHNKNLSNVKYEDWVNKCDEEINNLISKGYNSIYVIGHSMGGVIACYLASKYPQIKKLVLAAPAFHYLGVTGDKIDVKESIKDSTSLLKTYGGDEIFARFLKLNVLTIKEFSELIKTYYEYPKSIKCPVLIIHGDIDKLVPLSASRYVYDNVLSRYKTLLIVKGITHDVFKNPRNEDIFPVVKKFLEFGYKNGEINI